MFLGQYIEIPTELVELFGGADALKAMENLKTFLLSYKVDKNGNFIHRSAKIHNSAIVKNSFVGPKTTIHEYVTVRESLLWEGIQVGHCSEVVRSIVLSQCSIPRFNYIGSSIIGNNVRFGGMCAFATRRFDDDDVFISSDLGKISTNKKKFGSIIGDNTIIGFASHGNPGTVIGKNCVVMPHVELKGIIPNNSIVSIHQEIIISKKRNVTSLGLKTLKR